MFSKRAKLISHNITDDRRANPNWIRQTTIMLCCAVYIIIICHYQCVIGLSALRRFSVCVICHIIDGSIIFNKIILLAWNQHLYPLIFRNYYVWILSSQWYYYKVLWILLNCAVTQCAKLRLLYFRSNEKKKVEKIRCLK